MNKKYQPYQQDTISTIGFLNLKKTFLLLIIIVHYSLFASIFAQNIDPNGYNEIFYSNGNKSSEGNLENGKPNGYWKTYFESGILKTEGNRIDFKLDSTWKFYSESNFLRQTITYREGLKNGLTIYYDSLQRIQKKENFKSNLLNGAVETFYITGQLKSTTPYLDDKKEGFAYEYDSLGLIITITEYTNGFLRNNEEINRYDSEGQKNGVWKEFYESGKIKWEGKFAHGDLNGVVKEYTSAGGLKTMEKYEEGKINEESEEVVFFELEKKVRSDGSMLVGGYSNEMKQGVFREYDSIGNLLISYEYKNDIKLAEGSLDTNGSKHGLWKYYYSSGEIMSEGEFDHGYRNNEWKFYYKNKDIQQKGKYIKAVPNGLWTWWYQNGQVRREEGFRRGKEDGTVIEYDTIGNILTEGEFVDGIKDGKWYYKVNDHTEVGEYRDDVRHGVWKFTYKDGKTAFEGEYFNGLPMGKHKYYYPNGQVQWEGKYENGMKEGEWKQYDDFGISTMQIQYKRGEEYKINGYKIKSIEG